MKKLELPKHITKPIKVLYQVDSSDVRVYWFKPSGNVQVIELEPGEDFDTDISLDLINVKRKWVRSDALTRHTYAEAREAMYERIKRSHDQAKESVKRAPKSMKKIMKEMYADRSKILKIQRA